MAFYEKLIFDSISFERDFEMLMEDVHSLAFGDALNNADSDVWKDIKHKRVSSDFINGVYEDLYTESIQAFIKIYGSGVKSDKNNPFLASYMNSEVFNPKRGSNMEVHYRPKQYKTFDWENDKRDLVNATGSGGSGVYEEYPATKPNLSYMKDVLSTYKESFVRYALDSFKSIEKDFQQGKYFKKEIVKI